MYIHEVQKRVRYGETDRMGYLYYGQYAQYYEIGRVELIRSLGMSYRQMEEEHNIMLPVMHVEARFLKPALYDDMIRIETSLTEMPDKMITFRCRLYKAEQSLIHRAIVKLFFIDIRSGKRLSAPDFLVDRLKPYF